MEAAHASAIPPTVTDTVMTFVMTIKLGHYGRRTFRYILEPAPQGMGAPQATGNTQGNDVEAHRSLSEGFLSPPRIHLMPATMVCVAYYTTRSHPDGGRGRDVAHRKHA